jgi:hypothetical protein
MMSSIFAIGMELYRKYWKENLDLPPNAFSGARFFNLRNDDTWYSSLDTFGSHYLACRERWEQALYVGNKVPAFSKASAYYRVNIQKLR